MTGWTYDLGTWALVRVESPGPLSDKVFPTKDGAAREAFKHATLMYDEWSRLAARAFAALPGLACEFETDDTVDLGALPEPRPDVEATVPGHAHGLPPQRGPKVGGVVMPKDPDTDDLYRDEGSPVAIFAGKDEAREFVAWYENAAVSGVTDWDRERFAAARAMLAQSTAGQHLAGA
jgi:hypothetical protein